MVIEIVFLGIVAALLFSAYSMIIAEQRRRIRAAQVAIQHLERGLPKRRRS